MITLTVSQAQNIITLRPLTVLWYTSIWRVSDYLSLKIVVLLLLEQLRKCNGSRSWSRVLAIACYPFYKLWNWKFTLQMHLLFKSTPDSSFVLLGTHQWSPIPHDTFVFRCALCGKTVPERFQFLYFSWPSSHHQAYLAVAGDSDGHSAFKFRVGLWSLSVWPCPANAIFPQRELIQTLSREFEFKLSQESLKGAQYTATTGDTRRRFQVSCICQTRIPPLW